MHFRSSAFASQLKKIPNAFGDNEVTIASTTILLSARTVGGSQCSSLSIDGPREFMAIFHGLSAEIARALWLKLAELTELSNTVFEKVPPAHFH